MGEPSFNPAGCLLTLLAIPLTVWLIGEVAGGMTLGYWLGIAIGVLFFNAALVTRR